MMANYTETLHSLYHRSASAVGKPMNLEPIQRLCHAAGDPHKNFPIVHVAGSNGKGSTVTKITASLEAANYRVGMITSPHLSSFRERISISGHPISEEETIAGVQELLAIAKRENIEASFFELSTCLAFLHFSRKKVDISVVEVGLGGRLDATNIVTPILSIITSISLEHTHILGDTCEAIAAEKAGIIKEGVPVVIGPHADFAAIRDTAALRHAPLYMAEKGKGSYDSENRNIAYRALEHLQGSGWAISEDAINQGLKQRPPCRMEEIHTFNCPVILDVAHNPDGVARLLEHLQASFPHQGLRLVCGFSRGKDVRSSLALIGQATTKIHLVSAKHPRALPTSDLAQECLEGTDYKEHPSVTDGVKVALAQAELAHETLVICGSFFLMAEARAALGLHHIQDPLDFNEAMLPKS